MINNVIHHLRFSGNSTAVKTKMHVHCWTLLNTQDALVSESEPFPKSQKSTLLMAIILKLNVQQAHMNLILHTVRGQNLICKLQWLVNF